jgi:hypothetical protein
MCRVGWWVFRGTQASPCKTAHAHGPRRYELSIGTPGAKRAVVCHVEVHVHRALGTQAGGDPAHRRRRCVITRQRLPARGTQYCVALAHHDHAHRLGREAAAPGQQRREVALDLDLWANGLAHHQRAVVLAAIPPARRRRCGTRASEHDRHRGDGDSAQHFGLPEVSLCRHGSPQRRFSPAGGRAGAAARRSPRPHRTCAPRRCGPCVSPG